MRKTVPALALAAVALAAAACSSSITSTSSSPGAAASGRPAATATAPDHSAPAGSTGTSGQPTVNVKVEGMAPGTKAICAALTGNPELSALVGTSPSSLKYATGTVTASAFGLNKVPGCQIGIDPTATNVTVAWAICNYPDVSGFTDGAAYPHTTNVFNFAGTANGGFIVLGPKTGLGILTGTAGNHTKAMWATAMQDAAKLFEANGGCSSS